MSLSPKYQSLRAIRSPATRMRILQELETIDTLITELKHRYTKPELISATNRFFTYLEEVCKDVKSVQRNAEWILRYSQSLKLKLHFFTHGDHRLLSTLIEKDNRDLMTIVESLISSLITLYPYHCKSIQLHEDLNNYLTDFHAVASHFSPNWTNVPYLDIRDKVMQLSQDYSFCVDCSLLPPDIRCTMYQIKSLTAEMKTVLLFSE